MPHRYTRRDDVPKTMRALAKVAAGPGLKLIEALVPTPGPDEVLIRVKKTSVTESDFSLERWTPAAANTVRPPLIGGSEFAGLVAATGSEVHDLRPGETVIGENHVSCGICPHCLAARREHCTAIRRLGRDRDGAFAEYVCLPRAHVWSADPRLPLEILAGFTPLGRALRAAMQLGPLGASVLVNGADVTGCLFLAIARHAGARCVVVADTQPERLALATRLGANRVVDTRHELLVDAQQALGLEHGFDCGVETSGHPQALGQLVTHLQPGARILLLAEPPAGSTVDWNAMIGRQLTVEGMNDLGLPGVWERLTHLLHHGLDIAPVLTRSLPVGEYPEAFALLAAGHPGRIVLDWDL